MSPSGKNKHRVRVRSGRSWGNHPGRWSDHALPSGSEFRSSPSGVDTRHSTQQPSFALLNGQIHRPARPPTAKLGSYRLRVAAPQRSGRIFLAGEMTDCCSAGQAAPQGSVAHRPGYQGPHSGSPRCSCRDPVGTARHGGPSTHPLGPSTDRIGRRRLGNRNDRRRATWRAGGFVAPFVPWFLTPSCLAGTGPPVGPPASVAGTGLLGLSAQPDVRAPVWSGNSTSVALPPTPW